MHITEKSHLHVHVTEKSHLLPQVPGSNASVVNIAGFAMQDVDAMEAALKAARFCIVARRSANAGATAFYMSCKTGSVSPRICICIRKER